MNGCALRFLFAEADKAADRAMSSAISVSESFMGS
jgi:hypothetical protein